ncbi:uncharacterized protein LOC131613943 [Vicia villosa]|uniref:uncharacterized protein LOC131613943 n=1 Tax=Vicia villosa TaxID=3911 RepID=UPI00273B3949|nr:uncharacterized protein LOC131613943 [Vicia villosa]
MLLKVGKSSFLQKDLFIENCCFKVGNGFNTPFWEVCWLNDICLSDAFPELFAISLLKKVSVAVMGGWSDGVWKWGDLGISVDEAVEAGLFSKLLPLRILLDSFAGCNMEKDSVSWKNETDKSFTVSSCYRWYASWRIPFGPINRNDVVLEKIWKMEVPFKIKAFAWRLFVNRLPTKDLLKGRDIVFPTSNLSCVFCGLHMEDRDHIFFKCNVIKLVWKDIGEWVAYSGWKEEDCIPFFKEWYVMSNVKRIKEGKLGLLWLATCWIIWLTRNDFCFKNEIWNINDIVWKNKVLLWRWSSFGDITYSNCNFYDFCKDPLSFLS